MSLRAWYVLNGNVKNQGLGDFELTQVTAPTWATGKLCNQALNGGAFNWTAQQTAKILNNNELSYSCWIYVGEADTRSRIFGNDTTGSLQRYFSLFQYPTKNDLHWYWNQSDTGNNWTGGATGVLPTGKWTHVCFAYKSGYARIYINGEQVGSGSPKVNISNYSIVYNVILNNTNHRLQDIRIYDHCLSLKEVKELAKGLCLHYKLDDQFSIGQKQVYSGTTAHGYAASTNFTRTKLANEDGYNYKGTRTPTTTANTWWALKFTPAMNHTAVNNDKYYIWSSKVRCNTWNYDSLTMRNAIADNDYTHGGVQCCNASLADGEWHQYTRKYKIVDGLTIGSNPCFVTQSAYDASTASGKRWVAPYVEYYTGNLNNTAYTYNFDFDIKEVQLIEADEFPGWIDNDGITDVVDCAGVNNKHLTNYKSCTLVPSPVYRQAYNFNQKGYCYNSSVPLSLQQFTISLWVKPITNTSQHFLFGTFDKTDSSWTNTGIGVFRNQGNNYYQIYFKSDAESSAKNMGGSSIVCTLNTWTHMVIWWNGTTSKVYLNGVLKNTQTYGLNGNCLFKNIYLGNSMFNTHPDSETEDAAMSDFRVYATALTEDDILELYQTRASVDNDKNFYGYYLKEV